MATWDVAGGAMPPKPCDSLRLLHPPPALDAESLRELKQLVRPVHRLQRKALLYRAGARFQAIYVVASGAIKSYRIAASGEEQIAGFHLPGEFFGLSAIGPGFHPYNTQALEASRVCALPYDRLSDLARQIPVLQRQLLRLMSEMIAHEERLFEAVAGHSAERRLAFMLMDLRRRQRPRCSREEVLRLPMSRAELGGLVGLAAETTTRVLRRFEGRGWIATQGQDLRLRQPEALYRLAGRIERGTAA